MNKDRLGRLHDAGVSIWLDILSRELLDSGAFARLIADRSVTRGDIEPDDLCEGHHRLDTL